MLMLLVLLQELVLFAVWARSEALMLLAQWLGSVSLQGLERLALVSLG